jgi:hypothetical protein
MDDMVDCSRWSCSWRGQAYPFTNASDSIIAWTSSELLQASNGQKCICRCDSGWRSIGDLYGAHCRVHSLSVWLIWLMTAMICTALLIVCFKFLYAYWRHHQSMKPQIVTTAAAGAGAQSFLPPPQSVIQPPLPSPVLPLVVPTGVHATSVPNGGQPGQPHIFLPASSYPPSGGGPRSTGAIHSAPVVEESAAPFNSRALPYHIAVVSPLPHFFMGNPNTNFVVNAAAANDPVNGGAIAPNIVTDGARVHELNIEPVSILSSPTQATVGVPITANKLGSPVATGGGAATGPLGRRMTQATLGIVGRGTMAPPRLLALPQVQYVLLCLSMASFYLALSIVKLLSINNPLNIAYDLLPTLLYAVGASLISWCIFLHAWRIVVVAESISSDHSLTIWLATMKRCFLIALAINCSSYFILIVPIYVRASYNNDPDAYWTDEVQEKCLVAHLMVKTFSLGSFTLLLLPCVI